MNVKVEKKESYKDRAQVQNIFDSILKGKSIFFPQKTICYFFFVNRKRDLSLSLSLYK